MAQSNLLPGFTSALGDELNKLAGRRLTRLVATFRAEERLATAPNNASSNPAGTIITLGSGTWGGAVVAGTRFRVLSGAAVGRSALILTVDGPTQVTLVGAGLGVQIASATWEVVRDPDTTATVESTFDMLSSGRVFIGETLYAYTGKTISTLTGLSGFDGVSFVTGALRQHDPLEEVLDANRALSALDQTWRQLFVRTADGVGLSMLGASLGVPRLAPLLDDDIYRALIEACAFSHHGTRLMIAAALEAVFGEDGYELHEEPNTRLGKLYARREPDLSTTSLGKTFLAEPELYLPASVSTVNVDAPDPIRVVGVRLADDSGERTVQESEILATGTYNAGTRETTVLLALGVASANIRPGDLFVVVRGKHTDLVGTIEQRVSASELRLGEARGLPTPGPITSDFVAPQWKIVRPLTNARIYKPSGDTAVEYRGDPGTQAWTYVGANEAGDTALTSDATGLYTRMTDPAADTAGYRRVCRIDTYGYAEIELTIRPGNLASGAATCRQVAIMIRDGSQSSEIGFRSDGAGNTLVGFIDGGGTFTSSVSVGASGAWLNLKFVKEGRDMLRLYRDGRVILERIYTAAIPIVTTDHQFRFGCLDAALNGATCDVKQVSWQSWCPTDFWGTFKPDATLVATDRVDTAPTALFTAADLGRRLRVQAVTAANATDGNGLGSWEISEIISPTRVRVTGPRRRHARLDKDLPGRVVIVGVDDAFRYPDNYGHSLQILTGDNVGAAVQILNIYGNDDRDLVTLGPPNQLVVSKTGPTAGAYPKESSSVVTLTGSPAWVDDIDADWKLVPNFPADAGPVEVWLDDRGVQAGTLLTFGTALSAGLSAAVLAVDVVRVRTATLTDPTDRVVQPANPGPVSHFPFTLADSFGWVRLFLDQYMPATYKLVYDELYRDASGLHIADNE